MSLQAHSWQIPVIEKSQLTVFLNKYKVEIYRTLRYHANMYCCYGSWKNEVAMITYFNDPFTEKEGLPKTRKFIYAQKSLTRLTDWVFTTKVLPSMHRR